MKKIGIYLAYAPNQSIKREGISRLLSFILKGILESSDTSVVIAMPAWFKLSIEEFLQEQQIDLAHVELLTTHTIPYVLRIQKFLFKSRSLKNKQKIGFFREVKALLLKSKKTLFSWFMDWVSTDSPAYFYFIGFILLFLGLAFLPLVIFGVIMIGGYYAIKRIVTLFRYRIWGKIKTKFINDFFSKLKSFFLDRFHIFEGNLLLKKLYRELRVRELHRLAQVINKRSDISVWFVPALVWPEIKEIRAKKIVAAPDVVFLDFPMSFTDKSSLIAFERISETIRIADGFICYSEYVKQKHLVNAFSVDEKRISVIPHGFVDLSVHFDESLVSKTGKTLKKQAMQVLQDYQRAYLGRDAYLGRYNLSGMRYLLYSSQVRPYKNFDRLIKAYEILLRERFVNVKLIVTGNLASDPSLHRYLLEKRLQYDVLVFHDLSPVVLAALNALAICAVNPTLFEGGFPFTFTEAYSVGTPSVMSRIPVVTTDILDEGLSKVMLFDPQNIEDMVDKMEWAVNNAAALFKLQAPLYQKFQKRSWKIVAKEYVDLLTGVAEEST